jgi:alpha-amylase
MFAMRPLFLLCRLSLLGALLPLGMHCFGQPASDYSGHPMWIMQSNVYEVNLRQYSKEGTFLAFEKSLPRLRAMGVEVLWFMPINPIGLEGRKNSPAELGSYYSVKNYYAVNPEFGTMAQWIALVKKAHNMGFKVILDWVPNHSSPDNSWITAHPDFYKKDSSGKPLIPYDWTDTRKLNYDNPELRDTMLAAMQFWVKKSDIDGFRCDVAGDVPDDFWKEAITSLKKMKPLFMLAEGDKPSLHEDGFDATYPWQVMSVAYGIYSGKTTLHMLDSVVNWCDSTFPEASLRMYYTTNHDENSWNGTEFERFGEGYKAFAVWAFTMNKSVPLIYSGQEEPNRRRLKFFVKDTIPWNGYQLAGFYKTLNNLRRSTPALAADASFLRLKTDKDQAVDAYIREKFGHRVLVLINFSSILQNVQIQEDADVEGRAYNPFTGQTDQLQSEKIFTLAPWAFLVYDFGVKKAN